MTIPSFHLTVYDDSGSVYLACRTCTWEVEILDWGLDSINDEAAEHQAQAHPS